MGEGWEGVTVLVAIHSGTGRGIHPHPGPPPSRGRGETRKMRSRPARIIGVSVQEMVGDGVEVIIGVNCDPQLGPVLLFGSGGVMVEVSTMWPCGAARSRARKHRP